MNLHEENERAILEWIRGSGSVGARLGAGNGRTCKKRTAGGQYLLDGGVPDGASVRFLSWKTRGVRHG